MLTPRWAVTMFKKVLTGIVVVVVLLALAAGALLYSIFGGNKPIENGASFGTATVIETNGFVSMYLVEIGNQKYVLVDAGVDPDAEAVKTALAERGASADDVVAVLLTHGHSDHIGGAEAFPNAKIYLHEADFDLAAGRASAKGTLSSNMKNDPGITADIAVTDRQDLEFGTAKFRVYHVPGHTAGSVVYLLDGTLFMGDAAQVTTDDTLTPPPGVFTDDPARAIQSVRRLAATVEHDNVPLVRIVGGHSGSTTNIDALKQFPGE